LLVSLPWAVSPPAGLVSCHRHLIYEFGEELLELDRQMATVERANSLPAGHVQGSESRADPSATTPARLPDATRALEAFHVTRLGFAAVYDVRRRVQ
jgi:hypothetical protein